MTIPLSLYVHIPWCIRKCPYCDFNSHEVEGNNMPQGAYVEALLQDLGHYRTVTGQRPMGSIFIGGGTPSLLLEEHLLGLMAGIRHEVRLAGDAEITMEANPGSLEGLARFRSFRSAGINRLSIGVQSFDDRCLSALGRIHNGREAGHAFALARAAGFDNINIDLMHGLPDQTLAGALADLRMAITLAPEHISWYQLTIEPNTVFFKRPPTLPDDEILWDIQEAGINLLAQAGYHQYEVSAFARTGANSRHNLNYWQFGDYVGIGAGAHGKLTLDGQVTRTTATRLPRDYLQSAGGRTRVVEPAELPLEFLMNSLRLTEGFSLSMFEERTLLPAATISRFIKRGRQQELLDQEGDRVTPTRRGQMFLNNLLMLVEADLIPSHTPGR